MQSSGCLAELCEIIKSTGLSRLLFGNRKCFELTTVLFLSDVLAVYILNFIERCTNGTVSFSVTRIIIIIMEWRASQSAWLFPRHSAKRNDIGRTATCCMEAKVEWLEISFEFVAKISLDDLFGGANPRGDDWWNLAVLVHGLETVLLGQ